MHPFFSFGSEECPGMVLTSEGKLDITRSLFLVMKYLHQFLFDLLMSPTENEVQIFVAFL